MILVLNLHSQSYTHVISGSGFSWAVDNVTEAYEGISKLVDEKSTNPVNIIQGSATNLSQITDKSITAIVIDPPYADNV